METTYTFRNIDATEALKDHSEKKLAKISKLLIKPTSAHVIFGTDAHQHKVEVTILANGIRYVGSDVTVDMYQSIDGAMDKIERQLKKYKEQAKDHHHKEA